MSMVVNPHGFGVSYPALSSPTTANTKLLLHFDGTNGSTTFTDSGPIGHTLTANNQAQISTAQKVFGTASGLFDGNDDYLGSLSGTNFNFGSGVFSIFTWIRPNGVGAGSVQTIVHRGYTATKSWCLYHDAGALNFVWSNTGTSGADTGGISSATGLLQANQWQLVGVTRDGGGTIRLFHALQGAASVPVVASENDSQSTQTYSNTGTVQIGRLNNGLGDYSGYMDELLVTLECLATAEFAMPSSAFTIV